MSIALLFNDMGFSLDKMKNSFLYAISVRSGVGKTTFFDYSVGQLWLQIFIDSTR